MRKLTGMTITLPNSKPFLKLLYPWKINLFAALLIILSRGALSAEYTMNKECAGEGFRFSVTKVVASKEITKITLTPSSTRSVWGKFNAPGSPVTFHLVAIDKGIDEEIVDIEGVRFGESLNTDHDMLVQLINNPRADRLSDGERADLIRRATSLPYEHPIILEFPAIPNTVKRFHIREVPADKSDWACLNIKLE